MKHLLWLVLTFIALPTFAQGGIHITVDPGDSPLVISGWLDEGKNFTGNLRLTADHDPGGSTEENPDLRFRLLASDLKSEGSGPSVGREHVALVGEPVLRVGVPTDFQVTVTGITEPAIYQGKLEILPVGRLRSESLVIDFEVIAHARPTLKSLRSAAKLELNLVNCKGFSCQLAGFLLPESAFLDRWDLQFDNPTTAAVKISYNASGILGEKTRYPLTGDQLALPEKPDALPPRAISAVPLTIKRTTLPPDHYTGALYLMPEGAKEQLEIPVDLNVRTGPLGALIAILAGIILGRLFKYMQERGKPQAEKLTEVNRVELVLRSAHAEDSRLLEPQLAEVRQQVYREDLATVTERLKAIEARLTTLAELRQIEQWLKGKEQHPKVKEVLDNLSIARKRLAAKQDVSEVLAQVREALNDLQRNGIMGGGTMGDDAIRTVDRAAAAAAKSTIQVRVAATITAADKWLSRIKNALIMLSGLSDELRAEATLWIVRPLLYFVLLFGLVAVGLDTFYVSKGLTFGATPFSEYLGLILWGFSADVAGRTLSNLQGTQTAGKT
jgi:hypothetical protein